MSDSMSFGFEDSEIEILNLPKEIAENEELWNQLDAMRNNLDFRIEHFIEALRFEGATNFIIISGGGMTRREKWEVNPAAIFKFEEKIAWVEVL